MIENLTPYSTPGGVEAAIKEAAKKAVKADPRLLVNELIKQAYFDRFLCRVFSEGKGSQWVLKGGSGMLARVPNTRRTLDIDAFRQGQSLESALAELRRLAEVNLGDHFTFTYRRYEPLLEGEDQPYAVGRKVTFDCYIGAVRKDTIRVDLTAHYSAVDAVTVMAPANRLDLPRLLTSDYRLYPIENQIADKVCATISMPGGQPSSREKDLVDLVVIAQTQEIKADALRDALTLEARRRRLTLPDSFLVPEGWGRSYHKESRRTPAEPVSIDEAKTLMHHFIDPVLSCTAEGVWEPETGWAAAS